MGKRNALFSWNWAGFPLPEPLDCLLIRQAFKLPCLIVMALLIKSQRYIVVCEARLIGSRLNLSHRWISSISQSNGRMEKPVEDLLIFAFLRFRFCLFSITSTDFKNYSTLQLSEVLWSDCFFIWFSSVHLFYSNLGITFFKRLHATVHAICVKYIIFPFLF